MLLCKRTAKKNTSSRITTEITPVATFARDGGLLKFDVMPGGGEEMGVISPFTPDGSKFDMLKLIDYVNFKSCEIPEYFSSPRILQGKCVARMRDIYLFGCLLDV